MAGRFASAVITIVNEAPMRKTIYGFINVAAMALAACGNLHILGRMSDEELDRFSQKSIHDFLSAVVARDNWQASRMTSRSRAGLEGAVNDLFAFCKRRGGVPYETTGRAPYPEDLSPGETVPIKVTCKCSAPSCAWTVNISYQETGAVRTGVGNYRGRLSYQNVAYEAATAADDEKKKRDEAESAAKRLADEVARQQTREKAEAQRKLLQQERTAALQKSPKIGDLVIVTYHKDWVGTKSFEGMIIDLKKPIALIQFSDLTPNQQWIQIDRLQAR